MQGDTPNPAQPAAGAEPVVGGAPAEAPVAAPATTEAPAAPTADEAPVAAQADTVKPAEGDAPVFAQQPAATPANGETPVVGAPVAGGGLPKNAIIGICAGVGGLILVVLAIIFIPMLLAVNYEETYNAMEELSSYRGRVYTEDCSSVEYKMTNSTVTDSKYAEYVSGCKADIESLENAFNELEKQSGVKRDDDIKKKFEELKPEYEKYIEGLNAIVENGTAIHGFYANYVKAYRDSYSYEFLEDLNDGKVDLMVQSLTDSSNEKLKTYGTEFADILKKAVTSYKAYVKAKSDYYDDKIKYAEYREYYEDWSDTYSKLSDKYNELSDVVDEVIDSDFDDVEEKFRNRCNELSTVVSKKYYEHRSE